MQDKVNEALLTLPEQARAALAEREVLRVQIRKQSDEMNEQVEEIQELRRKIQQMKQDLQMQSEVKDLLAKKNAEIKVQLGKLQ